jgi:hypothetical protein
LATKKTETTSSEPQVHWALPKIEGVEPARLRVRLDVYDDLVLLQEHDGRKRARTVRMVSPVEIARAFTAEGRYTSGILPTCAFWWGMAKGREMVALWRDPQVWRVALQREAFKPPVRYRLPMPGLIFVCSAGQPPAVFAAPERPRSLQDMVFRAPTFNVFTNGVSCQGTQRYSQNPERIPEEFFTSFFTVVEGRNRSKKHPELLALWEELDGQASYPLEDLVPYGPFEKALEGLWR